METEQYKKATLLKEIIFWRQFSVKEKWVIWYILTLIQQRKFETGATSYLIRELSLSLCMSSSQKPMKQHEVIETEVFVTRYVAETHVKRFWFGRAIQNYFWLHTFLEEYSTSFRWMLMWKWRTLNSTAITEADDDPWIF